MSTRITKTWFDNETLVTQEVSMDDVYKPSPEATPREDKSMAVFVDHILDFCEHDFCQIEQAVALRCLETVKNELRRDPEGDEDETD